MERIDRYADLIVRVGANVQQGQTLFVTALVEHAPLARALARAGYRAGARLVDVRYADNHLRRAFIEAAPEEELTASPPWLLARAEAIASGCSRTSTRPASAKRGRSRRCRCSCARRTSAG